MTTETTWYRDNRILIVQLHTDNGAVPEYVEAAAIAAQQSRENTKVGAVIVNRGGVIISRGCNTVPAECDHCCEKHDRLEVVTHAEMAALLACDVREAYEIYVYGLAPCANCLKHLIGAGVRRIFFTIAYDKPEWKADTLRFISLMHRRG